MRKTLFIFATGFVLILSAGFVSVPAAHAQLTCDPGCVEGSIDGVKGCVKEGLSVFCGENAAQLTAQANANASANTPLNFGESSILNKTFAYMMSLLMTLFAWLLGVAMVTLDNTVLYLVVKMGSYVNNLAAIGVAWRILRDVGNIALIFGFLAIGITTILNVDWYGGGKKMLPMLLVAAVFLNFSLFMTEAVIDTGNLFATQFYTQINGGVPAGEKTSVLNETISSKIMSQLGFQKLYGDALTKPDLFKENNMTLIGLMGILLFVVAAFVMFSLAFVLIARFVYLIYLMVIAPLGFAGLAIPQLKGLADKWWHDLFAQTLTAPVLLLLLYVALAVITDKHFLRFGNDQDLDFLGFIQAPGGGFNLTGFASILLSFLVAMGLLLAVVISAKKLSAFGGKWAMETAGKLTFGATAWAGRTTGGWAMQRASQGWRKMGLSRAPVVGRVVSGLLDRGAKASFDVRGATTFGGLKALDVEAGAAQKDGFRGWEEGKIKEREKYAKSLEQTTGTFWGIGRAQWGEEQKQRDAEEEKKKLEKVFKDTGDRHKEELQDLLDAQKKDLQGYEDKFKSAQLNLAKMEGDLRKGKDVSESDLAAATVSVQGARQARDNKLSEQRTQQKSLRETQRGQIQTQQAAIEQQEQEIATLKRAPQEGYTKGLRLGIGYNEKGEYTGEPETLTGKVFNVLNPKRNTEAAKNVIKFASKGKNEKDSDKLFELLEKATKEKEGGGEESKEKKKEEK